MKGLVIDDDPFLLNLVFKYLTREGCEVVRASDIKAALNIINGQDFDFILCDMKMPGMGGADFYRIVQEKKPSLKTRIIFSTGDIHDDSTREFMDSVANSLIEKPFNFNELKELIIKISGV